MEDFGTCYTIILNNAELRQGIIREAERSRRLRQAPSWGSIMEHIAAFTRVRAITDLLERSPGPRRDLRQPPRRCPLVRD
jgi:hypothetical protein